MQDAGDISAKTADVNTDLMEFIIWKESHALGEDGTGYENGFSFGLPHLTSWKKNAHYQLPFPYHLDTHTHHNLNRKIVVRCVWVFPSYPLFFNLLKYASLPCSAETALLNSTQWPEVTRSQNQWHFHSNLPLWTLSCLSLGLRAPTPLEFRDMLSLPPLPLHIPLIILPSLPPFFSPLSL